MPEPEDTGHGHAATVAASPRTRLVLTVHGIRTYGLWQDRIERILTQRASPHKNTIQWDIRHYQYGFFTVFSFLIPWFRNLAVKRFRRHLTAIFQEGQFDRIDIIAHSFGTFLAINGLAGLGRSDNVRVHTAILCGSVLSPDYDLSQLVGPSRRIRRIVNDCGIRDGVLLLTLFIIGVGMGGRLGLHGFQGHSLTNRYFNFGHSGYFASPDGGSPDEFMRRWWLPVLLEDRPVEAGPPRPEVVPLSDRIWRTLGENGAAVTALFYAVMLTLVFGSIGYSLREAKQQRFATLQETVRGQAARARRLFDTGNLDESIKELQKAVALTKGYSLQQYFPEALSALRTINAEFSVIGRLKQKSNDNVIDLAFDKTGHRLATASWDGIAQLWDIPAESAPKWRANLEGHRHHVQKVRFTPDAKLVVTASLDGHVGIWEAETGKNQTMLEGTGEAIVVLAISPDGAHIAAGGDSGSVMLWDFKTRNLTRFAGHTRGINAITFSRDGRRLSTASDDGTARVWDVRTKALLHVLKGHTSYVTAVSFTRDGQTILTASLDKSVRFWSVSEGKETGKVENPYAYGVTVDPTDRYFATAPIPTLQVVDAPAVVWELRTRSSKATLRNDRGVYLLAFNSNWQG